MMSSNESNWFAEFYDSFNSIQDLPFICTQRSQTILIHVNMDIVYMYIQVIVYMSQKHNRILSENTQSAAPKKMFSCKLFTLRKKT